MGGGAHRRTTLVAAEAENHPRPRAARRRARDRGAKSGRYCSLKVAAMSLTAGAFFRSDEAASCTVTSR